MRDNETVVFVYGHAVGTASAGELNVDAHACDGAVGRKRKTPYSVRAGGRHEQHVFLRIQHEAVRARHAIGDLVQHAIRRVAIDAPARVRQIGLALIGKVKIAIDGESEIVVCLIPSLDQPT